MLRTSAFAFNPLSAFGEPLPPCAGVLYGWPLGLPLMSGNLYTNISSTQERFFLRWRSGFLELHIKALLIAIFMRADPHMPVTELNNRGLDMFETTFTVTKIKQERTKIGPFLDFLLHFSIFLLGILNIASQLSCKAMLKILSKNVEKCRRKLTRRPILVLSW